MKQTTPWQPLAPDIPTILETSQFPLDDLAAGHIPAVILRNAYAPEKCSQIVTDLTQRGLLFDPSQPMPDSFQDQLIPEGYYREGKDSVPRSAWQPTIAEGRSRIDIGSSLGYRGSDKEAFLAHSAETRTLFTELFPQDSPIDTIYDALQQISRDKRVVTAYEPDGRQYGPAIIRAHYGGYAYAPHFDSVRLRENRQNYAVYHFQHQFAGVLVFQNTTLNDQSAQSVLHHCLWEPHLDNHLSSGSFHEYAKEKDIDNIEIHLQPGDLYFFNTRSIHEVPGVAGADPRVVMATFIGFSSDEEEIFVWS